MKVEMNIGLNVKGGANSLHQCTLRARRAIEILRNAGLRYKAERLIAQHEGDDGILQLEDTLVVEIDAPPVGSGRTVKAVAYDIAVELQQDCVAVLFVRSNQGELVGPNATSWGEFNPEFFNRFADVALPRAA